MGPRTNARGGSGNSRHMRPGAHPGMRAAAELKQQQGGGGGRGMIGIVLPMYAIGIVVYLIYTLVKVFGGKSKSNEEEKSKKRIENEDKFPTYGLGSRDKKFTFGDDFEGEDDYHDYLKKKERERELESLLHKVDARNITEFEMQQLQLRLAETEQQMSLILEAMQGVQAGVTSTVSSTLPQDIDDGARKSDSSPDLDSFEVIKTSSESGSGTDQSPMADEVAPADTISAAEVPLPTKPGPDPGAGTCNNKTDVDGDSTDIVGNDAASKEDNSEDVIQVNDGADECIETCDNYEEADEQTNVVLEEIGAEEADSSSVRKRNIPTESSASN